ncbi:UNVERIFIED_ORG: hypothetical protein J2Y78_002043 [Buttiauxella agrestis ATCC 33320]
MTTQLDNQLQTQDAAVSAEAATPLALLPGQSTAPPQIYDKPELWEQAAQSGKLVNPPSVKEINKQMWTGSFMTALIVGLTTKDLGSAIAGGLMGSIAIHDYGHSLRQRSEYVPQMQKDGYSNAAIMDYYKTGNQTLLNQERDDMLDASRFKEQVRTGDRNFVEGQRRFDENADYREESLRSREYNQAANRSQRQAFQNASMTVRRAGLDLRRQQLTAQLRAQQTAAGAADKSPRQIAQAILQNGVDPTTGKAPTGARIKQVQEWQEGNSGYAGARASLVRNLDQVTGLLALDVSDGTGALAGQLPAWAHMGGGGQHIREQITSLQSQEFLRNVQALRGMGALTAAEGDKLQSVVASLDPRLDETELRGQLGYIQTAIIGALERADNNAVMMDWDMPEGAKAPAETSKPAAETKTSSTGTTYTVERD